MEGKHESRARFMGYCSHGQGEMVDYEGEPALADVWQRLLCFEYLPRGSPDPSHGPKWRNPYQITGGMCEGLYYLHIVQLGSGTYRYIARYVRVEMKVSGDKQSCFLEDLEFKRSKLIDLLSECGLSDFSFLPQGKVASIASDGESGLSGFVKEKFTNERCASMCREGVQETQEMLDALVLATSKKKEYLKIVTDYMLLQSERDKSDQASELAITNKHLTKVTEAKKRFKKDLSELIYEKAKNIDCLAFLQADYYLVTKILHEFECRRRQTKTSGEEVDLDNLINAEELVIESLVEKYNINKASAEAAKNVSNSAIESQMKLDTRMIANACGDEDRKYFLDDQEAIILKAENLSNEKKELLKKEIDSLERWSAKLGEEMSRSKEFSGVDATGKEKESQRPIGPSSECFLEGIADGGKSRK